MKKLLIAVLLLGLISCEKEPIKITYEISSIIKIDNNTWIGEPGLTYKIVINGDVTESYTEHVGITRYITLEDGDYIEIEGWTDNPRAYVDIRINDKSDKKKAYNYKRIDN